MSLSVQVGTKCTHPVLGEGTVINLATKKDAFDNESIIYLVAFQTRQIVVDQSEINKLKPAVA